MQHCHISRWHSRAAAAPQPCSKRQPRRCICIHASYQGDAAAENISSLSRRQALLAGTAAAALLSSLVPQAVAEDVQLQAAATAAVADRGSSSGSAIAVQELQLYENTKQQYRMNVPVSWDRKEKAGEQETALESTLHFHFTSCVDSNCLNPVVSGCYWHETWHETWLPQCCNAKSSHVDWQQCLRPALVPLARQPQDSK